jgi:paraquat-inducible protein A
LALGLSLPVVRLPKLAFFSYGHSPISAVNALVRSNQLLLAGFVLIFLLFLPVLRFLYLLLLATVPSADINRSSPQLRTLEWLGRWSPHDMLVLALAVAMIASHGAVAQRAGVGAYFLAAGVFLMGLAYVWLRGEATPARLRPPAAVIAHSRATRAPAFGALLGLAAATFLLGVGLPAIRLNETYAGADLYSFAGLVWALYARGETVLGLALLTLAVLLPGLRLVYLLTLFVSRALPAVLRVRAIAAAEMLGRYAIADTMLLGVVLFYLIASGRVHAVLQPGVYFFAASALLIMLAYAWTSVRAPAAGANVSLAARLASAGEV